MNLAKFTLLIECLEIWSYEIIALMSGYLAIQSQAALAIDWSINFLLVYIPYSFYLTISTLVGNSLGQGKVLQAKVIFRLTFYVCILIVGSIIAICQLYSRDIVKLYDDDVKV